MTPSCIFLYNLAVRIFRDPKWVLYMWQARKPFWGRWKPFILKVRFTKKINLAFCFYEINSYFWRRGTYVYLQNGTRCFGTLRYERSNYFFERGEFWEIWSIRLKLCSYMQSSERNQFSFIEFFRFLQFWGYFHIFRASSCIFIKFMRFHKNFMIKSNIKN